jgi:hypothetical protein
MLSFASSSTGAAVQGMEGPLSHTDSKRAAWALHPKLDGLSDLSNDFREEFNGLRMGRVPKHMLQKHWLFRRSDSLACRTVQIRLTLVISVAFSPACTSALHKAKPSLILCAEAHGNSASLRNYPRTLASLNLTFSVRFIEITATDLLARCLRYLPSLIGFLGLVVAVFVQ